MYMDEGMDTGDMILQEKVEIGEDETTGELWEKLSKAGAKLLVETVAKIENGTAPRQKQPEGFSIAPMLKKEMAEINWEKPALEIKNLIRGLNPIMGAYTTYQDKKLKIWKADAITIEESINLHPEFKEFEYRIQDMVGGSIICSDIQKGLYVKANNSILVLVEVQAENSKRMSIQDFLRGNHIEAGEMFA